MEVLEGMNSDESIGIDLIDALKNGDEAPVWLTEICVVPSDDV
jgi:hypothetical protein